MIGGILFFVIELKFSYQGKNNIAQLFLKLLCKYKFLFLSKANPVYSSC